MRLFFGLELEQDTVMQVARWRDQQFPPVGRPVPPANFHITLAFIGELTEPALERLCLSVDHWLESGVMAGATIDLDHTGYWHKPGIYWLGPSHCPTQLSRLAEKLRILSCAVGARRDKRQFQPHITLFRGCTSAPPPPLVAPALSLSYQHVTLFESRQGRQGVSYHPLRHWELEACA